MIYRILAMIVTSLLIVLMFPHEGGAERYDYKVGAPWRGADLTAPFDFAVMKSTEDVQEEEEREHSEAILYYTKVGNGRRIEVPKGEEWGRVSEGRRVVVLEGNVGREYKMGDFEWVEPNDSIGGVKADYVLDRPRTALELESRLSQLNYESELVMAGERIVGKGEVVTEEKGRRIAALEVEEGRRFAEGFNVWGQMAGQLLLAMISFVALYMFLLNTRHRILEDNRRVLMVLVAVLMVSAMEAMMVRIAPEWVLLVPMCVVPILMRVFFDMRAALYIHLTTVIVLANLVPNSFEFIFYQLVTGMMSIIAVRNLEKRAQFFVLSAVIFVSYSLIYTAGVLSQDTNFEGLQVERYLMFFLNAVLTLLAYPLIYLFERLFGMTTALTLMELSSTNNEAMRTLSRRAPGTFQHSVQVANIAEDVVSELGGNALLARVGALYHDIGKIRNPIYFTENQTSGFNPHDELDNEESARMITSHVTEGLKQARKYHLPAEVQDFIRTHHGTTMTGYFYAKELEKHPDGDFDVSAFRYPGPRPYSRETAVVMIVDTVEAACRSLKNHTKESTDAMIDKLIDGKIAAGQLDNCPLSYGDIARVRKILKEKMM
ncbi:MAG: HDIG domain-containing protein, partial [Bacteroidales bacterium]|nr:HDIG domain-containing protein [Bacteroidales bacterium]